MPRQIVTLCPYGRRYSLARGLPEPIARRVVGHDRHVVREAVRANSEAHAGAAADMLCQHPRRQRNGLCVDWPRRALERAGPCRRVARRAWPGMLQRRQRMRTWRRRGHIGCRRLLNYHDLLRLAACQRAWHGNGRSDSCSQTHFKSPSRKLTAPHMCRATGIAPTPLSQPFVIVPVCRTWLPTGEIAHITPPDSDALATHETPPMFSPAQTRRMLRAAAACLLPAVTHAAPTYTVLYSFTGQADGAYPQSQLIADAQGNLYGTAAAGGVAQPSRVGPPYGVVFRLAPDGTETVLHDFGRGHDGADPQAGLVADAQGNLYGTTAGGGPTFNGTAFRLSPAGHETILHDFAGLPDGAQPEGSLLRLAAGDYIGTTYAGGTQGAGAIFRVRRAPSGYDIMFSFTGAATGTNPIGNLIRDPGGTLYGTVTSGGAQGAGAVFAVTPANQESLLYSFQGGNDGSDPIGGLLRDKSGNLYGVTYAGGAPGYGTIFRVAPDGAETILHAFAATKSDGGAPYAGLVRDSAGNFYGTTTEGGKAGQGTVFSLSPGGKLTLLHSFTGPDGSTPLAALMLDKQGNNFGTASLGGASDSGVVFEIRKK